MSSDELQRTKKTRVKDSSDIDYDMDIQPASSIDRNLGGGIQLPELGPCSFSFDKYRYMAALDIDSPLSPNKPSTSAMKEKKPVTSKVELAQDAAGPSHGHSYEKSHHTNPSTSQTKKDAFPNPASEPKKKTDKSSDKPKPAPFKGFPASLSQLPLTKEKLAASLSLEEACGYLPNLMKSKRVELTGKEFQVDQISVDLQVALRDAKNICILLEKATKDIPNDIQSARIQAQKLKYLLSSSFNVFQKLDRSGKALKEHIQLYSKQTGDYHSSVDVLLEYIVEKILEKCKQIKKTSC